MLDCPCRIHVDGIQTDNYINVKETDTSAEIHFVEISGDQSYDVCGESTGTVIGVDKAEAPTPVKPVMVTTERQHKVGSLSETIIKKGYSPYLSEETGTWFEYDDRLKKFVDTGVNPGSDIPLATQERKGLMSPEDKKKLDNMDFKVDFSNVTGFHTLTIGEVTFDGKEDKYIPVYKGEINNFQMEENSPLVKTMNMDAKSYNMKLE